MDNSKLRAVVWADFACAAMQGILANPAASEHFISQDAVVAQAEAHADAMLLAWEKRYHA